MADLTDLQRRAAAASARLHAAGRVARRHLPGMATAGGWRLLSVDADGEEWATDLGEVVLLPDGIADIPSSAPLLSDDLTVAGLVLLAREAWGVPDLHTATWPHHEGLNWYVGGLPCGPNPTRARTEAEAAVAALEAAVARLEVPRE